MTTRRGKQRQENLAPADLQAEATHLAHFVEALGRAGHGRPQPPHQQRDDDWNAARRWPWPMTMTRKHALPSCRPPPPVTCSRWGFGSRRTVDATRPWPIKARWSRKNKPLTRASSTASGPVNWAGSAEHAALVAALCRCLRASVGGVYLPFSSQLYLEHYRIAHERRAELSFRADVLDTQKALWPSEFSQKLRMEGLEEGKQFRNWRAQEGGERMWSVEDGLRVRLAALAARADVGPAERPAWEGEPRKIIMTMHQIMVCGYQRHVWSLLTPHLTAPRELRRVVLNGISGLSCPMVERVLQHAPLLSMPRGGTHRSTNFVHFHNTWVARLQLLFDWDDRFARSWDGLAYRQHTRRLHIILEHTAGLEYAGVFRRKLGLVAARYLWIVPRFDGAHLCLSLKVHPHYSVQRRAKLEAMLPSARWQWLAALHPHAPDPGDVDTATAEWRRPGLNPAGGGSGSTRTAPPRASGCHAGRSGAGGGGASGWWGVAKPWGWRVEREEEKTRQAERRQREADRQIALRLAQEQQRAAKQAERKAARDRRMAAQNAQQAAYDQYLAAYQARQAEAQDSSHRPERYYNRRSAGTALPRVAQPQRLRAKYSVARGNAKRAVKPCVVIAAHRLTKPSGAWWTPSAALRTGRRWRYVVPRPMLGYADVVQAKNTTRKWGPLPHGDIPANQPAEDEYDSLVAIFDNWTRGHSGRLGQALRRQQLVESTVG
ncbi:MAG: hypothetical protein M1826_000758 [Phylliscum demangeonii]|nr:MAG: hypothetical protein M1826_000758 [Phylliscum demangeonii]